MLWPVSAQQTQQPFEPFINRLKEGLGLSQQQVAALREVLAKHAPMINDLRARAQRQPVSPQLVAEVERQQQAIRDEIVPLLSDDQKAKLSAIDLRVPIPMAPPFVPVNIAPRARPSVGQNLAAAERLIPAVAAGSKKGAGRLTEEQKILHLLNRATFGPRPGDVDRVRRMGIDRFLDEQLHPESIDDSDPEKRLAVLPTFQMTAQELFQFYPPNPVLEQRSRQPNPPPAYGTPRQILGELVQHKLVRGVSSNRQLHEVMTDFWFNHFNVFALKDANQWLTTGYERDVIRPRALGKFRDLVLAVAESPAMLFYLDNWLSASPDSRQPGPPAGPRPPGQPDTMKPPADAASMPAPQEPQTMRPPPGADPTAPGPQNPNLRVESPQSAPTPQPRPPARKFGINENYARELMELHTLGVDGGYTQKDVQEVSRCFTGWTIDRPNQGGGFVFRPWMHDNGAKTVLGVTIPAGGGISDGERVINILSRHPSTARFISKKLCRRFVSDDPPAQLVERVAQVFLKTDGDIREVLRAIFTSPEFYSSSAFRSKLKSPLELVASAIRAIDGDTNGGPQMADWLRRMGEPLYLCQAPTGYSDDSSVWMNSGLFLNRLNFRVALASNQIPGTRYDPGRLISADAPEELLTTQLAALIVHTELGAESLRAVRSGLSGVAQGAAEARTASRSGPPLQPVQAGAATRIDPAARRIAQAIGLLFGTSEFQRK
jgi:uncharacterized protein (DUF1800 family)